MSMGSQVSVSERLSAAAAVAMRFLSLSFPVRQGKRGARGSLLPSHRVQSSHPDLQRAVVTKDAERFQLAMQGRTLHPDKSGGAGNVAAKAGHLGDQVFALEGRSRIAQRQGHDLAPLVPFDDGGGDRGDVVRQHVGAYWLARITWRHD